MSTSPLTDPQFCSELKRSRRDWSEGYFFPFLGLNIPKALTSKEIEYYQALYNLILNEDPLNIKIDDYRFNDEDLENYEAYLEENSLIGMYLSHYSISNDLIGALFFRRGIEAVAEQILEEKRLYGGLNTNYDLFYLMDQAGLASAQEVVKQVNQMDQVDQLVSRYGSLLEETYWVFQNLIVSVPPLDHSLILFRGVDYDPAYQTQDIGRLFHFKGITSTSLNLGIAKRFGNQIFMFLVPEGFSLLPVLTSHLPEEAEVLLPHSTACKLLGWRQFGPEEGFNFIDYYKDHRNRIEGHCHHTKEMVTLYFCQVIDDIK